MTDITSRGFLADLPAFDTEPDIVERLRAACVYAAEARAALAAAAAEIELLRGAVAQQQAELDALRAAPQQAEPDLLDALKRVCSHSTRTLEQITADWDNARRAIARAEQQPTPQQAKSGGPSAQWNPYSAEPVKKG